MKSIDANVALRWLTRDDPHQTMLADEVMRTPVFVALTVLAEVAWVLGRSYRFDRTMINGALRTLVDLETVTTASEAGVRWALDRHEEGAALPDMIHLVASRGARSFVSFERRLARHAGATSPIAVETLA